MLDQLTMPKHPLTGLRALGIVGGRPVWPIRGGSEPALEGAAATSTAPTGVAPSPDAPAPTVTPAAPAADPAEPEARDGEDAEAFLARVGPQAAAKLALKYRGEAGDRRVQATSAQQAAEQKATDAAAAAQQKILDDLRPGLIALGVIKGDEQPDAAKLAEDLRAAQAATTEQQAAAKTLQIENVVLRTAGTLGVNADRLLDSRRFADTVAQLDPAASDFGSKIEAAMKAAAEKDATLKSTLAVPAAGLPHVGGSGGTAGPLVPTSLADAVAATMNPTR